MNLQKNHPESTDQIAAKQAEIVGLWEGVKHKVCTPTRAPACLSSQRVKSTMVTSSNNFYRLPNAAQD